MLTIFRRFHLSYVAVCTDLCTGFFFIPYNGIQATLLILEAGIHDEIEIEFKNPSFFFTTLWWECTFGNPKENVFAMIFCVYFESG